jgi:hypothetical protein
MRATFIGAAVVAVVGCGKTSKPSEDPAIEAIDRYTVRGEITAMPSSNQPKEIEIDTERIPAFKAIDGKISPMEPMPMPYSIGDLALTGLAIGDPVEISFEVHWKDMPPLRLTRIEKLPTETKLQLGK